MVSNSAVHENAKSGDVRSKRSIKATPTQELAAYKGWQIGYMISGFYSKSEKLRQKNTPGIAGGEVESKCGLLLGQDHCRGSVVLIKNSGIGSAELLMI